MKVLANVLDGDGIGADGITHNLVAVVVQCNCGFVSLGVAGISAVDLSKSARPDPVHVETATYGFWCACALRPV
jgi:hypothetical protein